MVVKRLIEETGVKSVIEHGYCVGCGACAGIKNSKYKMEVTSIGTIEANTREYNINEELKAARVCPFSDFSMNEDQVSAELFKDNRVHKQLGRYLETYAGHVIDKEFRKNGSSGGMGSWLLDKLLTDGHVDYVVNVGKLDKSTNGLMYGYKVCSSSDELSRNSKSKYYPITLDNVIKQIRETPGRYAITGVPCFIKAIRQLSREDSEFGKSIIYCVGLICGHLKSCGFAEFLGWQMGINPENLTYFDFRIKNKNHNANQYNVLASGKIKGEFVERTESMNNLFGKDWGMGLFKLKACDYCDDVVAETADVTIGDAWLPQYIKDSNGTNIVIIRNKNIINIINQGINTGTIKLDKISPDEVVKSQGSGYKHRRQGLAYRLWFADSKEKWRPIKRIEAQNYKYKIRFKKRHRLRIKLAELSHNLLLEAKKENDINIVFNKIVPLSEEYLKTSRPLFIRTLRKLKNAIVK